LTEPQKFPGLKSRYRRIRVKPGVAETIGKSRTTILINMILEIVCAVILMVGIIYFTIFLIYFRRNMIELYFRIFLGVIILFTLGWFVYFIIKFREHYYQLKKSGKEKTM
jgi:hypothetical protein